MMKKMNMEKKIMEIIKNIGHQVFPIWGVIDVLVVVKSKN